MRATSNREWFVADFETTSEKYYIENGYTKVWLYAICDSQANIVNYGSSIDEFFEYLLTMKSSIIYFHNLKFDGQFILSYLLNNGYKYKEDLKVNEKGKFYNTLIGSMGEFYMIKVNVKTNKQIIFQDSLKVLPFKVKKIAKDFKLPIMKEVIDYDNYEINEEKLSYVFNDVKIVAMALKIIKEEGITKRTTASSAYHYYIEGINKTNINEIFPSLDIKFLQDYRDAYRGGRCQVNELYRDKVLHNVKRFDINSMYPYVMRDFALPYGVPIETNKVGEYEFELYDIDVMFRLKPNHLPSLLAKGGLYDNDSTYYTNTEEIINIKISNIDFQLLQRNYELIYLKFNKIYGFNTTKILFTNYVNHFYELKSNSYGAQKICYKLFLNSLYGKFGSKVDVVSKIPQLNEETGIIEYETLEAKEGKHYYLPIAIAITSYAHKLIDDAIHLTGIENFVYCDTDSVHTLGSLPNSLIDNKELGKFKLEGVEKISKYVRQKTYIYKEDEWTLTCAGLNEELKEKAIQMYGDNIINEFKQGFEIKGKLLPKKVKGGCILSETTFKIK